MTSRFVPDSEPVADPRRDRAQDIMRRLRERTADVHAATEDLPIMRALMAPGVDAIDYHRYLAALYGVYRAIEPMLYAAVSPGLLTSLGVRPKLPALQRDLAALDARLGRASALPDSGWSRQLRTAVTDEAAAVGGLYVLEGATLGGRVIARRLRRQWGAESGMPFAFLDSRGASPDREWRRFGDGVRASATCRTRIATTADDAGTSAAKRGGDALVSGALAVFGAIHEALRDAQPGNRLKLGSVDHRSFRR